MPGSSHTPDAASDAALRAVDDGSQGTGLVSIIIPCYNAADVVADAIDCALAQTYPAVEVVVVDDASTDDSREVVARYGDRVRALHLPANRGPAHARNRGVDLADGEWVMFLDADNLMTPDTIDGLVDAVRRAPGSLAACPWEFLQEGAEGWTKRALGRPFAPVGDPLAGWLEGHWTPPCALMYPRGLFLSAGGFDDAIRRNEDGDLAMRVFACGAGLALATRGKGYYRRHADPQRALSTDDRSGVGLRSQQRVLDKLVALLASQGRLDAYRALIEVQYGYIARHALEVGDFAVADDCLTRGGSGAARVTRSRTRAGRLLTAVLGLKGKHRVTRLIRGWRTALRRGG
jgi:O-antigen biosynthesis protein